MATGTIKNPNINNNIVPLATALQCVNRSSVSNGSSVSVSGESHDLYVVAAGTWNQQVIYLAMPAQGGAPKTTLLMAYGSQTVSTYPASANGNWGLTVTNNSGSACGIVIFRIKKHI